jgi:carbonic anhydrase
VLCADSRAPVPRARSATTESTFVHDVGVVVREYTQAVDGNISFSAIALVGSANE